jgi:membrane protein
MKARAAFRLVLEAVKGWSRDNVPRLGASLAYYTLFSLAPMLVIAIAVAGQLFGEEAVRGEIVMQVDGLIGTEGARALQALLLGARRDDASGPATLIGTIAFLLAATGAFMELQHALNTIFRVKQAPGSRIKEFVLDRLRSFGLVLSIGFLLVVSLLVSAALSALTGWLQKIGSQPVSVVWELVDLVVSLGVITLLLGLIYRYLPDVRLAWRDVWFGALVTALLFIVGKELIGLYLGRSTVGSSYGAAGSVMVLLLWVYYSAQIMLFGAELTRVRAKHLGREPSPLPIARRDPKARPLEERH